MLVESLSFPNTLEASPAPCGGAAHLCFPTELPERVAEAQVSVPGLTSLSTYLASAVSPGSGVGPAHPHCFLNAVLVLL